MKQSEQPVRVWMSKEEHDKLKKQAQKEFRTIGNMLRKIINDYFGGKK